MNLTRKKNREKNENMSHNHREKIRRGISHLSTTEGEKNPQAEVRLIVCKGTVICISLKG